jgi:hypothetical protein
METERRRGARFSLSLRLHVNPALLQSNASATTIVSTVKGAPTIR